MTAAAAAGTRRTVLLAWTVPVAGAALAALIAVAGRWGPDWPAQEFRAWSAAHEGLTAWTNQWYSGQALPGYSLIYPAVSARIGAAATGLIAVLVATVGAARMAPVGNRLRRSGFHASVALVLAADLLIGQVPYLLGVAFGVWALYAIRTRHGVVAALLAAGASVSSPLVGAFVLLCVPAAVVAMGWRRTIPFTGAIVGIVVSALYGGAGGPFPFVGQGLIWTLTGALALAVLPRDRGLRVVGLTYALAAVVAYAVPNPIGGNLARFGQLIALPLCWHVLPCARWPGPRPRSALAAVVALAALWPVWPSASALGRGASDPSRSSAFYDGIRGFLRSQDPRLGRLEVVFTREHWESIWVAKAFPIARGWERQTDLSLNAVLYHPLSAKSYRQWLDDNAVHLIALPKVPIDFGGRAEAELLRNPPSYLTPVWHDVNWQVWRVDDPHPLVTGPATVGRIGAASVELDFQHAGTATVRIRGDAMWAATSGEGCVSRNSGGWLTVAASHAGPIIVRARVSLDALNSGARCS